MLAISPLLSVSMPPTRMAAAILLASKDMQATPRGRTGALVRTTPGPAIGAEFSDFRPPCPTALGGVNAVSAYDFPAGLYDSSGIMSRTFQPQIREDRPDEPGGPDPRPPRLDAPPRQAFGRYRREADDRP